MLYLKSVKGILRAKDYQGQTSAIEADLHNLIVEVDTLKNRVKRYNVSLENNILLFREEDIFDDQLRLFLFLVMLSITISDFHIQHFIL